MAFWQPPARELSGDGTSHRGFVLVENQFLGLLAILGLRARTRPGGNAALDKPLKIRGNLEWRRGGIACLPG